MKTSETKHEIIENYYIRLIEENKVSIGEQLPSENEIANIFKVSRHTVRQALSFLVQEGWIYKERGRGSFFSENKNNKAKKNVAVLTTYISDYIFPRIISGIEEELSKRGYNLLLFSSNNNIGNEKKCFQNIINQNISGLIFEPAQSIINDSYSNNIKILEDNNIKTIAINTNCNEEDSAYIIVDDEQGGYKVTNYLLELGHRDIGAIFKADDIQGKKRMNGYKRALKEYKIEFNESLAGEYVTDNQEMYIDKFTNNILNMKKRPTAIVCYNDNVAMKIINEFRKLGIKVPKDISIVSFDDSILAISSEVKLTTIKHPKKEMGIKAAKYIIDMIDGKIDKPQYIYDAELIVRGSCKKI